MGSIDVTVIDVTGSREQVASLPDDAPVSTSLRSSSRSWDSPLPGPTAPPFVPLPPQGIGSTVRRLRDAGLSRSKGGRRAAAHPRNRCRLGARPQHGFRKCSYIS